MTETIIETKNCKACGLDFTITDQDIAFLEKLSPVIAGQKYSLPHPQKCPSCREQQRTSYRNRRNLYKRTCDFSGKSIISMYSPDKPFKVYNNKDYETKFDATEYGKDLDLNKSIMSQLKELQLNTPRFHAAVITDTMENADYVNGAAFAKNSYLSFSVTSCENVYYCEGIYHSSHCVDCYHVRSCELCYQCIESYKMHKSFQCIYCTNSSNCFYCFSCENCNYCFNCVNLTGKNYCIENVQYTKEEYEEKIKTQVYNPEFRMKHPYNYARKINTEHCTGDDLVNAKNCIDCFGCENTEDMRHVYFLNDAKDCMDVLYYGNGLERAYQSTSTGGTAQNIYFCLDSYDNVSNLYCCDSCRGNVKNCFACVGLKSKEYCILNKQYSKEEYESLIPKIIEKMRADGERGEPFPTSYSPFGYNESLAMEHFPLTKEKALALGYNRMDAEYNINIPEGIAMIQAHDLPTNIQDINDDILEKAIICEITGKPFRIVKQELDFYRQMKLSIPHKHPNQRHKERFNQVNLKKLRSRHCAKCNATIQSTYSPDRPEIVYCESCYQKEIYG